jgi:hypothetical protein
VFGMALLPSYRGPIVGVDALTNQLIPQLAPVLNASCADGYLGANPCDGEVLAKQIRVFADSTENVASTAMAGLDIKVALVVGGHRGSPPKMVRSPTALAMKTRFTF